MGLVAFLVVGAGVLAAANLSESTENRGQARSIKCSDYNLQEFYGKDSKGNYVLKGCRCAADQRLTVNLKTEIGTLENTRQRCSTASAIVPQQPKLELQLDKQVPTTTNPVIQQKTTTTRKLY